MDPTVGDLPYCLTHKAMLSCLETVISDIHVDLTSVDSEVNKCLPSSHQLPSTLWTPPFFKESNSTPMWTEFIPIVTELTKAHQPGNQQTSTCSSCVPQLASILLTLEKQIDHHVHYVDYIQEKMKVVPSNPLSLKTARFGLIRNSSISRSKIRTNPSLPVVQKSPKVLNLSQEFYDIASVSKVMTKSISNTENSHNAPVFQKCPPCLCCTKCVEAMEWFSDTVHLQIQYLKDQCHDLQTRLMSEMQNKVKELLVQLAQKRKDQQSIGNNFSRLESLGVQGLTICSNIISFEPVIGNQSTSSDDIHSSTRCSADGQSCDEESDNLVTQTTTESTTASSSSEGSYSLPNQSPSQIHSSSTSSACSVPEPIRLPENIYDESVINLQPGFTSAGAPDHMIPESPMPGLLEFQRKRSNSMNTHDNAFNRHTLRRRSNTISHPIPAPARKVMNASGPYSTIQETDHDTDNTNDKCQPALLHVNAEIAVTFPETKPRKMKKSKSSILVRATKLKNYIAKKFKRKSWGGTTVKKPMSPRSDRASSTGVQFFEYDFSDDGEDGYINATSDTLGNLSVLTGFASSLSSCSNLVTSFQVENNATQELSFPSPHSSDNNWFRNQIATIERHLNTSCTTEMSDQSVFNATKQCPTRLANSKKQQLFIRQISDDHFQMVLPPRPTNTDLSEFLLSRSYLESLSNISSIQPEESSTSSSAQSFMMVHHNRSCSYQPSSHDGSAWNQQMFETKPKHNRRHSINSFHDNSSFEVLQGYSSYHEVQRKASTPCNLSASAMTKVTSDQEHELLNHLCLYHSSIQGRQNAQKLCYLKPYLLEGKLTIAYLLNLIHNYPQNYNELPGYDYSNKKISLQMISFVSSRTKEPHLFARNLIWRLFTLIQLYGGKTRSGQNTESLDEDIIMAVRNATMEKYNISNHVWQYTCVTFIHSSINYLFNQKLHSPVFRALLQQSDC